jgi:hypothetical protein
VFARVYAPTERGGYNSGDPLSVINHPVGGPSLALGMTRLLC